MLTREEKHKKNEELIKSKHIPHIFTPKHLSVSLGKDVIIIIPKRCMPGNCVSLGAHLQNDHYL